MKSIVMDGTGKAIKMLLHYRLASANKYNRKFLVINLLNSTVILDDILRFYKQGYSV